MAHQLNLLDRDPPGFDREFRRLARTELARGAWVDYAQNWVTGHVALFEMLLRETPWQETEQEIYDRTLATPRLVAALPSDQALPPLIEAMRCALVERYREPFARVSLALYRNGRDSVAFHGDRVARELPRALVATVSLGAPRRFVLRPRPPAPESSHAFQLGWGDLLVMGGSCQRTWQHAIPKVARAEPRIAIMFRPVWQAA